MVSSPWNGISQDREGMDSTAREATDSTAGEGTGSTTNLQRTTKHSYYLPIKVDVTKDSGPANFQTERTVTVGEPMPPAQLLMPLVANLGKRPNSGSIFFGQNIINSLQPDHIPLTVAEKKAQTLDVLAKARDSELEILNILATQVPAVVFPLFKRLPAEVQLMIWEYALPTFVEVISNRTRDGFFAPNPREAVFWFRKDFVKKFLMLPIYLQPMGDSSKVDIIYIRPQDTLYLGAHALLDLDIEAFVTRPENQIIENLAIQAVSAKNLRWCGTVFGREIGTRTYIGDLVRGLRYLKKLYIVEGPRLHSESSVSRWAQEFPRRYWVDLKDVPAETTLSKREYGWMEGYHPPPRPWTDNKVKKIMEAFEEEVKREKSGLYEMKFKNVDNKDWSPPELVFHLLTRREITLFSGGAPVFIEPLAKKRLKANHARSRTPTRTNSASPDTDFLGNEALPPAKSSWKRSSRCLTRVYSR